MRASKLEQAILDWIAGRQLSLAGRISAGEVKRRVHTGAGFYVYLVGEVEAGWDRPPVDGPVIRSPQLDAGGGSTLWLSRGSPSCLEIYSFGNHFPEHLDEFELSSSDGSAQFAAAADERRNGARG